MTQSTILLDLNWDNAQAVDDFKALFPDAELINWDDANDHDRNLAPVKFAVVWGPEPGLLANCPNLEVIFSVGAGVDHLFKDPDLPQKPIVRFVDPNLTGPMVEWVVLQVLMHMRQQRQYDGLQRAHEWRELAQPSAPKFRVGIMGFGELGQASATVLRALGFQLNSWSRSPKEAAGVSSYHGMDQLEAFLQNTDILISLLPLTIETRGLLNKDLINQLSRNGPFGAPILINAGRGASQVEDDILDALKDGRLHGASLDVFEEEPLPASSPLWDLDNLVITPHAAAISDPVALARHVAIQIGRFENGEELEHLVDRQKGY